MEAGKQINAYWEKQFKELNRYENEDKDLQCKLNHLHKREAKLLRIMGEGRTYRKVQTQPDHHEVDYSLYLTYFIQQGDHTYIEEEEKPYRAYFYKDEFLQTEPIVSEGENSETPQIEPIAQEMTRGGTGDFQRFKYDRRKAVQYAERWWNDYNPKYKHFEVDCTNFISQCLHEGGAPMWGSPSRSKGWWFNETNWSYSWSVANAFRWYLSGSTKGLKGKELEEATELLPGDVICYDFEGDGKWNHSTIVVDKDANGEPLVNAHTYNSRHRHWSYEDSTAYTPNIQYKFFRIGE